VNQPLFGTEALHFPALARQQQPAH